MTSLTQPLSDELREYSDLDTAIRVAQQLLNSGSTVTLREALRLLLRALDAEPGIVRHANGAEYRVVEAGSYTARMARDIHDVTMADGTVWTTGLPIGWHGTPAAWRTSNTSQADAPPPVLATPAADAEPVDADEDARRFVARHFPTVTAFLDNDGRPSQADEFLRRARQNGGGQ